MSTLAASAYYDVVFWGLAGVMALLVVVLTLALIVTTLERPK